MQCSRLFYPSAWLPRRAMHCGLPPSLCVSLSLSLYLSLSLLSLPLPLFPFSPSLPPSRSLSLSPPPSSLSLSTSLSPPLSLSLSLSLYLSLSCLLNPGTGSSTFPCIISDCGERQTMSHLMTCVDAPNCTWIDLAMPTLAGVNCAKHWEESIWQSIEDSMKKVFFQCCFFERCGQRTLSSSPP